MVPAGPLEVAHTTHPSAVADIPALPGSYALVLAVTQALNLDVGRLGLVTFPPGRYVYFGSAMGPGGLPVRIRRHVQPDKSPHWHIDYLTQRVQPVVVHWQPATQSLGLLRLECDWCRRIARLVGVEAPVHHFGSTDCRAGCPAHLLRLPPEMTITQLLGELT